MIILQYFFEFLIPLISYFGIVRFISPIQLHPTKLAPNSINH